MSLFSFFFLFLLLWSINESKKHGLLLTGGSSSYVAFVCFFSTVSSNCFSRKKAFSNSFSSRHFTQKDNTSEGRLYNREKILLENGPMRSTTVQVVCNISRLLFLFQMAIPFNLCDAFNFVAPQCALRGPAFHTGSSQSVHPLIAFECIAVMVFFGRLVGPTSLRFFLFSPDGQYVQFVWMTWNLLH